MKKGEDDWEECIICLELTNFDRVKEGTQYWVCCGQRMCAKCINNQLLTSRGEELNCPFCRSPLIYHNEQKYLSQLLLWAEKGRAWAQHSLGLRYEDGKYAEKDIEKSLYYYALAAKQGYHLSQYNLGNIYLMGKGGVPVDYVKALHYYKLAADGGFIKAYGNIAGIYCNGLGVPKSDEKTFEYAKVAADNGDDMDQYNVGMLFYMGIGVKKDILLALKYLSLSADQNYEAAVTELARKLIFELEDLMKEDRKYLFQAIYRTKCALKIAKESDEYFKYFKQFIELSKIYCGACGARGKKESWLIQNLISKAELNGKICERMETLDSGRVKIKINDLILSVKPECLLLNKSDLLICGRCKVIVYCNINCQKKHWKELGHKQECKEIV